MQVNDYSVMSLVSQSDLVTKIILLVLFCMSVVCWALFFYKMILLNLKRKQLQHVSALVKEIKRVDEVRALAVIHAQTFPGYIITKILLLLQSIMNNNQEKAGLTERDSFLLQQGVDQILEAVIADEDSYLSVFSSCAAVSPLLGLFGTVWGLVHAFLRISQKQQADIATVAPGVAEALITTLAGLMVAIPSLMMFHYLHSKLRKLHMHIYSLADTVVWLINTMFIG